MATALDEMLYAAMETPITTIEEFLNMKWLLGAVVSLIAGVLNVAGIFAQKAAMHRVVFVDAPIPAATMKDVKAVPPPLPRWEALICSPLYWTGLCLMLLHYPVAQYALYYVPETPVAPLSGAELLLNFLMAYGLLNERFTRTDVQATAACVVGLVALVALMPQNLAVHVDDFPTQDLIDICRSPFWSNPGFAIYLVAWLLLLLACIVISCSADRRNDLFQIIKPFTFPLLVSLFTSQWHFVARPALQLLFGEPANLLWGKPAGYWILAVTFALLLLSLFAMCEGLRHCDCRFFVPTTVVCSTVMVLVQRLSFFREWQFMSVFAIILFVSVCMVTVLASCLVCPDRHKILLQALGVRQGARIAPGGRPFLVAPGEGGGGGGGGDGGDDVAWNQQDVLAILEEYHLRGSPPAGPGGTVQEVIELERPTSCGWTCLRSISRLVPLLWCVLPPTIIFVLYVGRYLHPTLIILMLFSINCGWKYGLHVIAFSYVGQTKMAIYEKADFQALHEAEMQQKLLASQRNAMAPPPAMLAWEDVMHFVLIVNYKEDLDILRYTMETIAESKIATTQICLVLAMEAREAEAEAKAKQLQGEFAKSFWRVLATYHPEGLEGEVPGKSANTRWAAERLFNEEFARLGVDPSNAVITVADADSEFHGEYFAALTYYYVHAGYVEGGVPERNLTIWQPPILHFKNYFTQPCLVRMASLFVCQKELACLADPNSVRLPYSTYSISATLAMAVHGWDPDWISEDWHMCLKCFLCTAGQVRITPIFFAVINTAPDSLGDRWSQAKRHALGFSEISFLHEHLPRVLTRMSGGLWPKLIFLWRGIGFYAEMISTHATMATLTLVAPFNAWVVAKLVQQRSLADDSWTFLCDAVFQVISSIAFFVLVLTSVLLVERVRSRLTGGDDPQLSCVWRWRILHFLYVAVTSTLTVSVFFLLGGCAEWIAAFKSAFTNQFHYEVAAKPTAQPRKAADSPGADMKHGCAAVSPARVDAYQPVPGHDSADEDSRPLLCQV